MSKVLVSCLVLNGSRSGYRRIIRNLLVHLSKNPTSNTYVFMFQQSGYESLGLAGLRVNGHSIVCLPSFRSKWMRGIAEQILVPIYALFYCCDLIFMPATFGLFFPSKPTLTFVHTNTGFCMPSRLRGRSRLQQTAHNILTHITRITSTNLCFTSRQTRDEYNTHFKVSREWPILGNGILVESSSDTLNNIPFAARSFLLSVSQFYRVKNHDSLIRAFIDLKKDYPISDLSSISLVIVGSIQERDFFCELQKMCEGRSDVIFLHDIDDCYLGSLYAACLGYCLFSYFEGYSLTPAEALLAGVPIAISDIPTHREIYQEHAFYGDPYSVDSIKISLLRMIESAPDSTTSLSESIVSSFSFSAFYERLESLLEGCSMVCDQ